MRAMSHKNHRIRLHYGSIRSYERINQKSVLSIMSDILLLRGNLTSIMSSTVRKKKRKDLVLVIGRTGQKSAKDLHCALHLMIPISATNCHFNTNIEDRLRPVLYGGRLVRIESCPNHIKSRRGYRTDPGTLIEEAPIKYRNKTTTNNRNNNNNTEGYVFRIRRIGDERLSFIHFNHDPSDTKPDDEGVHTLFEKSHIQERVSDLDE